MVLIWLLIGGVQLSASSAATSIYFGRTMLCFLFCALSQTFKIIPTQKTEFVVYQILVQPCFCKFVL